VTTAKAARFPLWAGRRLRSNLIRTLRAGLSADDIAARRHSIGGSDANTIASGNVGKLQQLWRVKTGREPAIDLNGMLPVVMGTWTEELNRYWFEKQTGLSVSREGERAVHPEQSFLTATLDGIVALDGRSAIFEAKHVNAKTYSSAKILARYSPQLHHSMYVTGLKYAVLSVFIGTMEWEPIWVEFDAQYHASLLDVEQLFWRHVTEDRSP
jgi:predicted phage-related endonuclease